MFVPDGYPVSICKPKSWRGLDGIMFLALLLLRRKDIANGPCISLLGCLLLVLRRSM